MNTCVLTFWNKVVKNGPIMRDGLTPCWLWLGSLTDRGYGTWFGEFEGRFKNHRAHRVAWALANGAARVPGLVKHECDNRACVNPDHLSVGTQTENVRERDERGRTARGERNGKLKLSAEDVELMRLAFETLPGVTKAAIARAWSVDQKTVRGIVTGRTRA